VSFTDMGFYRKKGLIIFLHIMAWQTYGVSNNMLTIGLSVKRTRLGCWRHCDATPVGFSNRLKRSWQCSCTRWAESRRPDVVNLLVEEVCESLSSWLVVTTKT